jgi:hypothetical protein
MPIQGLPYLRAKCRFVAAMDGRLRSPNPAAHFHYVRRIRIVCLMENQKADVRQLSSHAISAEEDSTVFPAEEAQ